MNERDSALIYCNLAHAILKQAIYDLRNWPTAARPKEHRPPKEEHLEDLVEFFDSTWYRYICESIGIDPDWLFETLMEARMLNEAMFSSGPGEWETPQDFFDRLDQEFHFGLDAAATDENAKCSFYYTKEENSLKKCWHGTDAVWCNPPYGREIAAFVAKGFEEAQRMERPVVMLVPARTDTKWWHHWVMRAAEIRFVRGRLKFVGGKSSAPFPSAVVIFRRGITKPLVKAMKA